MSADNWCECPHCKAHAMLLHAGQRQAALDAYGKATPERYAELCTLAALPVEANETFREDYGIGLYEDGTFSVSYRGGCEVCGLTFKYEHEEKVEI